MSVSRARESAAPSCKHAGELGFDGTGSVYIPVGREHPAPQLLALPVDLLSVLLEEYADDIVVRGESVGFTLLHVQVCRSGRGGVEGERVRA